MKKSIIKLPFFLFLSIVVLLLSCKNATEGIIVNNIEDFNKIIPSLLPGDEVILANGIWNDVELLFEGIGTKEQPIILRAQEKGKVFLEGNSNLKISGEYLVVSGLVFRNGFTPSNEVISFRKDKNSLANNSRVTECVIVDYNNPDRNANDGWVMMYGKNNRFDHNHIEGKRNQGVTMAVRLDSEGSRENYHRIDHNYFGPRPVLGSNGGETLRVGTSHYSLSNSFTIIENNFFENCDGEIEIISIKSGGNKIQNNVFFESKGTLTLRHGNGNIVEGNIFIGNGKHHTGGIRVINSDQRVTNNYLFGLTGYRFRGGIVIMNGVPDSPINRYHQVNNAVIENNTLIDVDHIQLAAGSDEERSAVPINSVVKNNLIYNEEGKDIFTVYDDISGIKFEKNYIHKASTIITEGIITETIHLKAGANDLFYPSNPTLKDIGVRKDLKLLRREETGVPWFPKKSKEPIFNTGKTIQVEPGINKISEALLHAGPGDILELRPGTYHQEKIINLTFPITISSKSTDNSPMVSFEGTHLFELKEGGSLQLDKISIIGSHATDSAGNAVIKISLNATIQNYNLKVKDCEFDHMVVNHSFHFLDVAKGSFADTIQIENSTFKNFTGNILGLDKETDDLGKYNAEYVILTNNLFKNIGGKVVGMYRGGTDESTFGPHFYAVGNSLENVGINNRNREQASIFLLGVQVTNLDLNHFNVSQPLKIQETVGNPVIKLGNNKFIKTSQPIITEFN